MRVHVFETAIAVTITNDLAIKAGGNVTTSPGLPYDYSVVIDGRSRRHAHGILITTMRFLLNFYFDEETSYAACDLL